MQHATSVAKWGILHLCVGQNLTSLPEVALSKQRGLSEQDCSPDNWEEPLFVVRNRSFPYKVELHVNGQPIPP